MFGLNQPIKTVLFKNDPWYDSLTSPDYNPNDHRSPIYTAFDFGSNKYIVHPDEYTVLTKIRMFKEKYNDYFDEELIKLIRYSMSPQNNPSQAFQYLILRQRDQLFKIFCPNA